MAEEITKKWQKKLQKKMAESLDSDEVQEEIETNEILAEDD